MNTSLKRSDLILILLPVNRLCDNSIHTAQADRGTWGGSELTYTAAMTVRSEGKLEHVTVVLDTESGRSLFNVMAKLHQLGWYNGSL